MTSKYQLLTVFPFIQSSLLSGYRKVQRLAAYPRAEAESADQYFFLIPTSPKMPEIPAISEMNEQHSVLTMVTNVVRRRARLEGTYIDGLQSIVNDCLRLNPEQSAYPLLKPLVDQMIHEIDIRKRCRASIFEAAHQLDEHWNTIQGHRSKNTSQLRYLWMLTCAEDGYKRLQKCKESHKVYSNLQSASAERRLPNSCTLAEMGSAEIEHMKLDMEFRRAIGRHRRNIAEYEAWVQHDLNAMVTAHQELLESTFTLVERATTQMIAIGTEISRTTSICKNEVASVDRTRPFAVIDNLKAAEVDQEVVMEPIYTNPYGEVFREVSIGTFEDQLESVEIIDQYFLKPNSESRFRDVTYTPISLLYHWEATSPAYQTVRDALRSTKHENWITEEEKMERERLVCFQVVMLLFAFSPLLLLNIDIAEQLRKNYNSRSISSKDFHRMLGIDGNKLTFDKYEVVYRKWPVCVYAYLPQKLAAHICIGMENTFCWQDLTRKWDVLEHGLFRHREKRGWDVLFAHMTENVEAGRSYDSRDGLKPWP